MSQTGEEAHRISQAQLDRVRWYHEFDFGNGLRAQPVDPHLDAHRRIWRFIERQLERIDFRGKTVLEIGSWDGYWSFQAERAGAKAVLATDDHTQNWSTSEGIWLARELLQSKIEVRQDVSIYELGSLGRSFDIIICFGVYYHLVDPFYGFTQLRHCCRPDTLLLLEGDVGHAPMHAHEARIQYRPELAAFLPAAPLFNQMLRAAYFEIESQAFLVGPRVPRKRWLRPAKPVSPLDRAFTVCRPFEGTNELHYYRPPFGLSAYDDRFRSA